MAVSDKVLPKKTEREIQSKKDIDKAVQSTNVLNIDLRDREMKEGRISGEMYHQMMRARP